MYLSYCAFYSEMDVATINQGTIRVSIPSGSQNTIRFSSCHTISKLAIRLPSLLHVFKVIWPSIPLPVWIALPLSLYDLCICMQRTR